MTDLKEFLMEDARTLKAAMDKAHLQSVRLCHCSRVNWTFMLCEPWEYAFQKWQVLISAVLSVRRLCYSVLLSPKHTYFFHMQEEVYFSIACVFINKVLVYSWELWNSLFFSVHNFSIHWIALTSSSPAGMTIYRSSLQISIFLI